MGMTDMHGTLGEGTTRDANMLVFKQLLAGLLALPFDRKCPRHVFGGYRNDVPTRSSEAIASVLSANSALGFMTFSCSRQWTEARRAKGPQLLAGCLEGFFKIG